MKDQKTTKEIKLLVLGEAGVGKTSIIQKFATNTFEEKLTATIGIDFLSKKIKYKNKTYQFRLIDTAGQERFHHIIDSYYHMGDVFFVVFDLTNEDSLNAITKWIDEIKEKRGDPDPKIIIIGNKDDLKDKQINKEIIEKQLENHKNRIYIKTSAKKNINIQEAFEAMIDLLEPDDNSNKNKNIILDKNGVKETGNKKKKKFKC